MRIPGRVPADSKKEGDQIRQPRRSCRHLGQPVRNMSTIATNRALVDGLSADAILLTAVFLYTLVCPADFCSIITDRFGVDGSSWATGRNEVTRSVSEGVRQPACSSLRTAGRITSAYCRLSLRERTCFRGAKADFVFPAFPTLRVTRGKTVSSGRLGWQPRFSTGVYAARDLGTYQKVSPEDLTRWLPILRWRDPIAGTVISVVAEFARIQGRAVGT